MEIGGLFSALFVGLIVGGLGRLVVPGWQPIGCLMTLLVGVVGALLGSAAARALDVNSDMLTLVLQVVAAAVLVLVVMTVSRRRR